MTATLCPRCGPPKLEERNPSLAMRTATICAFLPRDASRHAVHTGAPLNSKTNEFCRVNDYLDVLLPRMSPEVAQLRHTVVVARCPLLGAERKTYARIELFRF
jgi:hypothetical protein